MEIEIKRKIVHALGIYTVLLIQVFGKTNAAVIFLSVTVAGFLVAEYRKNKEKYKLVKIKKFDEFEDKIEHQFKTVERRNALPFKGAIEFGLGCFLATILFSENIAIACIAVLAVSDSLSTLVGYYFGKHKLPINRKKTWEGSTAFFASSAFILSFFVSPLIAVVLGVITTAAEAFPHADDNISIPIALGIAMGFLALEIYINDENVSVLMIAQFGGDLLSTIITFVFFIIVVFFGPRLMTTQTIFKLEQEAVELESMAEKSKGYVLKSVSKRADAKLKENVSSFMEFFAIGPVEADPFGVIKKIDHIVRNSDARFTYFVNQIAPDFSEIKKRDIKNALEGAMMTHQIAKVVRHYLELIKKYKMFQLAMIIQMQLPLITRMAKAAMHAHPRFRRRAAHRRRDRAAGRGPPDEGQS